LKCRLKGRHFCFNKASERVRQFGGAYQWNVGAVQGHAEYSKKMELPGAMDDITGAIWLIAASGA